MKVAMVIVSCFLGSISASAIPMWEYLTKDEKMSYLYSMFSNQVVDFCQKTTMANCNKELLKYGLDKLKDMPEDHLDTMDPYQRGANDLIWGSMMEGHEMMKSVKPKLPENDLGAFGSASEKIDVVIPTKAGIRVFPDGRPVFGAANPMPLDEDLRQYQMSKVKIPRL